MGKNRKNKVRVVWPILVTTLLVLLSTQALFAQQPAFDFTKFVDQWRIEGTFQPKSDNPVVKFKGTATWQMVHDNRYVHEQFEFDFNGNTIKGEAFLGESKHLKRFEFVQIDNANPTMFTLTGQWNETTKTLELESGPGSIPLRWHYTFQDDGSFIKKMFIKQPDGTYHNQSQYHYKKM